MPIDVRDIPFFRGLTMAEIRAVASCLIEKTFEKGEIVHTEGESCGRIFFVRTGRIKLYRTSPGGKEQIYEILGPGDTCACNPAKNIWSCNSTAEALTSASVWFLFRDNFVRLVSGNAKLMQALNEVFAKRLLCFSNIIEEITLKDSKKRLVKFLLEIQSSQRGGLPQNSTLFIPFTREEIANRLGTARETVARHISELRHMKVIDVKPYQITILDRSRLEQMLA